MNFSRSLTTALICLLTTYKEDFYDPPDFTILNYLLRNVPDNNDQLENQCQNLLHRFRREGKDALRSESGNEILFYEKFSLEFVSLDLFSSSHDVDKNNNHDHQSKSVFTDDDLYSQRNVDSDARKNFLDMSSIRIAEQLTIVDAVCFLLSRIFCFSFINHFQELLKRVLPYECLTLGKNSVSRGGLTSRRSLSTVDKTIEHFNAVTYRVVATILKENNEQIRARVMEKWIDIAFECRQLRNFSSLTAILNGLQSGCIYRLITAWTHVDPEHRSILTELKNIFGSCSGDKEQARAILDKVNSIEIIEC